MGNTAEKRNNNSQGINSPAARYGLFVLFIITMSIGDGLAMKAGIGTTAYEAFSLTLSYLTGIKVGTMAMVFNFTMVILQIILIRRLSIRLLLQIPVAILQGQVLNLIMYVALDKVQMVNYPMRLVFLLAGFTLAAFSVGCLVALDIVVMPLEGFTYALSEKLPFSFPKVRQAADVVCIALALLLTFPFKLPMTIREGTVIGMLMFGPTMGWFMKQFQKLQGKKM